MAINYKTLGDRIKTKRISQGITQEKFAEHMDVSVGYISQLERGISKVSLERLVSISEYFNCNIDFFIDGINSNTKGEHIKDAGLSARGCIPVAVKVSGIILSNSVH